MRWMNNPYAADAKGPGAVVRTGLAALDPRNGMPYTWNPTRQRGYGVYEFTVTSDGLLMGHDTKRVKNELRNRLAFFPLAGGAHTAARGHRNAARKRLPAGCRQRQHRRPQGVHRHAPSRPPATVDGGGQTWSTSRASWVIDGVLYTGWSNGTLTARTFSGGSVRRRRRRSTSTGLTAFGTELASMTGAFYDKADWAPLLHAVRPDVAVLPLLRAAEPDRRRPALHGSGQHDRRVLEPGRRSVPGRQHAVLREHDQRQPELHPVGEQRDGDRHPGLRERPAVSTATTGAVAAWC